MTNVKKQTPSSTDRLDHAYEKKEFKAKLSGPKLPGCRFLLPTAALPHEIIIRSCQSVCFLCNAKVSKIKMGSQ